MKEVSQDVLDEALNEIEDIVRSRPLLMMEIQEMVRESGTAGRERRVPNLSRQS